MKKFWIIQTALCCFICTIQAQTRDPYKWPFADTSIWNMPIGDKAEYVPANIKPATKMGMTVDEDYLQLDPNAPVTPIFTNTAGWDRNKDRCIVSGPLLFEAPMPKDWLISRDTWDGDTPNAGLAVILPDGRTIRQTQPFARCNLGSFGTSQYVFPNVDIYAEGIEGAHGATGMSAIGGTIRLGELVPGGEINHALKFNFFGHKNFYYDNVTKGFRWPARSADGYAGNVSSGINYAGTTPECRVGALVAIPASVNLDKLNLQTEPARIIARTLQKYGAYIVDDTAWDVYAVMIEWSSVGRVRTEFQSVWGFPMIEGSTNSPWASDMRTIVTSLKVVNNNTAKSVGGGGNPIAPKAPEFGRAGNISPKVFLTSPLGEIHIVKGQQLLVVATASDDDGSITKVQFFMNSKLIGEVNSEPYSLDYMAVNSGSYILTAKTFDNEGAVAVSHGLKIIVDNAAGVFNKPPTVSINVPADMNTINDGHPMNLTATAADSDGSISKVEYYKGFNKIGESRTAPYAVSVPFTIAGKQTYVAKVFDNKGAMAFSSPAVFDIPHINDLPTATMTTPKEGTIYGANKQPLLQTTASDLETEVLKVEFYLNDELVATSEVAPYSFRLPLLPGGEYQTYARAYDTDNEYFETLPIHFSVEKPVSAELTLNEKVEVYPNPFKEGLLTIKTPGNFSTDLTIFAVDGKCVFTKNDCEEIIKIPRDTFKTEGVYFVKILQDDEIATFKLEVF